MNAYTKFAMSYTENSASTIYQHILSNQAKEQVTQMFNYMYLF